MAGISLLQPPTEPTAMARRDGKNEGEIDDGPACNEQGKRRPVDHAYAPPAGFSCPDRQAHAGSGRSEEQPSELQSLMRISYAVFCLTKTKNTHTSLDTQEQHNTQNK